MIPSHDASDDLTTPLILFRHDCCFLGWMSGAGLFQTGSSTLVGVREWTGNLELEWEVQDCDSVKARIFIP